jgi:hypothetical protein
MDHKPFLGKMTSEMTSKLSTKISQVSTQLTSVFEDKLSNWKGELHQQLQELQASSVENQKHGLEWLSQSHASLNRASQQQNLWQQQWLLSTKHRLEAEHLHLKQQLRRLKSKRPQRPQRPELLNVTSSPRDISISELKQGYRFILFGFAICFAFNLIWEAIAQRPKL